MTALKFNSYDKEQDNFETIQAETVVRDWLESIDMPFSDESPSIDAFEFRSRDGFAAHSHNRGGLDLFIWTDAIRLVDNGEHSSLAVSDKLQKGYDDSFNCVKTDNPEMTDDEIADCLRDESSEYDTVGYRIRVMYEGNGVLCVYSGYDLDAPYFRGNGMTLAKEIHFKTLKGLARELKALTKHIEAAQYETKNNSKKA